MGSSIAGREVFMLTHALDNRHAAWTQLPPCCGEDYGRWHDRDDCHRNETFVIQRSSAVFGNNDPIAAILTCSFRCNGDRRHVRHTSLRLSRKHSHLSLEEVKRGFKKQLSWVHSMDQTCIKAPWFLSLAIAAGLLALSIAPTKAQEIAIRVGYFPNITHVHALLARNFERHGRSWFAPRLGPGIKVEWFAYNAGPSTMEAIFAESLDLTYVGPNPAINAYARSNGKEVRVIAGAVNGGSALVVQPDSGLAKAADFRGKRIATPQFGNTH
jgi:hypothetical protein